MATITSNSITFLDNTGTSRYLYIRYSNDGETFTSNNGTDPGEWMGTCSSSSPTAPTDFDAYKPWNKIKGTDGKTYYTWIKYADDDKGTNMSDSSDGKTYIGIAPNKETKEESENYEDYNWSLITSEGRGIDRIEEYYVATPNSTDTPDFSNIEPNVIPELNATDKKYLWNKEITYFTDGDDNSDETEPVIIGVYGDTGVGIKDIINYYQVTQDMNTPTSWVPENDPDGLPVMDTTNKYLWNYEEIQYTEGDAKATTPTIIGVYGDEGAAGAAAIMFEIYSPTGFEFVDSIEESEKIENITLQIAAFQGSEKIEGATYRWSWINPELNEGKGGEAIIQENQKKELVVNVNDAWALANLTCKMTLVDGGGEYYDYVTLRKKTDIYTANINFFEGTNVFAQGQNYIVAYVELYKNNKLEEGLRYGVNKYIEITEVDSETKIITTDYSPEDEYENMLYFVYNKDNNYEIILGSYDSTKKQWTAVDYTTKYTYANNLNADTHSNVFIVLKSDITRSVNLSVDVYMNALMGEDAFVATTNATIIDLNDVSVGDRPEHPYNGQLWFDTANKVLKVYNSEKVDWEVSSEQLTGQSIYTSRPDSYQMGDLWILGDDEYENIPNADGTTTRYTGGSFLRARESSWNEVIKSHKFDPSHWVDAMSDVTKLVNNVAQYMVFDKAHGLKLGQIDEKFYVNISSTRMSFCSLTNEKVEDPYIPEGEVVHISGQSASITNLEVEKSMDCNCPIDVDTSININNVYSNAGTYPGFAFQIEEDGGFSLIKKVVN